MWLLSIFDRFLLKLRWLFFNQQGSIKRKQLFSFRQAQMVWLLPEHIMFLGHKIFLLCRKFISKNRGGRLMCIKKCTCDNGFYDLCNNSILMSIVIRWFDQYILTIMLNKDKKNYQCRFQPGRSNRNFTFLSGQDRRSGNDRRKSSIRNFLLNGCIERRNWKERRFLWYMTMWKKAIGKIVDILL